MVMVVDLTNTLNKSEFILLTCSVSRRTQRSPTTQASTSTRPRLVTRPATSTGVRQLGDRSVWGAGSLGHGTTSL